MTSNLKAPRYIISGLPIAGRRQRIGLLGGSFNPAHEGHLQISCIAQSRLQLDEIWWLVSPRNPLKSQRGLSNLDQRIAHAKNLPLPGFIHVTSLESAIGARFSIETVQFLQKRFAETNFVWLIGADNLVILHRWHAWRKLVSKIPFAVIDRPGAGLKAAASPAAQYLSRFRLDESDASALATANSPAWTIIHGPLSSQSSTAIRTGLWSI